MTQAINALFSEQELLDILKSLIRIPSHTAYPERETKIAQRILELLRQEGVNAYLQPVDGERSNVIAVLPGTGEGNSLMLNGHMDTVPVFGMDSPFEPIEREGCLWGRGTADMKGGLAAMLYTVLMLHRSGVRLRGDLVFAGVIDEEAAKSSGSRYLAEHGPKTDFAIVGEPTGLYPVVAHNGIDYFQITFSGKAVHSSRPEEGANAIYAAADYATAVRRELASAFAALHHPLVGSPTVNVGLVQGSAAANREFLTGGAETFAGIVPEHCQLYLDTRWIPGQRIEDIEADLVQIAKRVEGLNPGVTVQVQYIPLPRPAMEIGIDERLTQALLKSIKAHNPATAQPQGVTYFADSGILYGLGGIHAVVFGPGDIAVAHSVDEHLDIEQLYTAARIYIQTAITVCG